MYNMKLFLIVVGFLFGLSVFGQDTLRSTKQIVNDSSIDFSLKESIDNITVSEIPQKLYVESDSIIYYLYLNDDIKSPFAIIPKSKFNFLDINQFSSMKILSSLIDRKKVLEFHLYLKERN